MHGLSKIARAILQKKSGGFSVIPTFVKFTKITFCIFIATSVSLELLLRLLLNFPLYNADSVVGYWPKPNQSGIFLGTHDWIFNDHSMGLGQNFGGSGKFDLLIVGDSVVYGGNPFRQQDKLAPIIARKTDWSVWPLSAGGWALQNELAFLDRNTDAVQQADAIVFILNSGDFEGPASWTSEITHPRSYPVSYLWYLIQRCCFVLNANPPSSLKVADHNVLLMWQKFGASHKLPIVVIGYSSLVEEQDDCRWAPKEFRSVGIWYCYRDLDPQVAQDYRDGIHPSVKGNARLANFTIQAVHRSISK